MKREPMGDSPPFPDGRAWLALEQIQLPPEPEAVREAREIAARLCAATALPPAVCETAILLTSEIVTNAVVHARTPAQVTILAAPIMIRVEVVDADPDLPAIKPPSAQRLNGRGLHLVEACASRWGVEQRADGKVVWFEIEAA